MKSYYLLLFLVLVLPVLGQDVNDDPFQVKYENSTKQLGIGLLKLNFDKQRSIEIFDDPNFSNKYAEWDSESPNKEIHPKFYELDYGICDFVCLEETKNYYKVLIGFDQIKYVKVSSSWSLTSWKNLIENSFGVTRKRESRVSNKLRTSKSDNSEEIPLELKIHENFCVNSLEDSWLNVKYDCIYATEQYSEFEGQSCFEYIDKCDNSKTGWIKWKQGGELLIQIYLMP